jgi:acetyltransferase-like isoleucine patch superfamily enzyme
MKLKYTDIIKPLSAYHIGPIRKPFTATPTASLATEVNIPYNLTIESYSRLAIQDSLYSIGSFSYCLSSMPMWVSIGRYCSIAAGVSVLGPRHPHERISSSPFTYDRKFSEIHSELDELGLFSPIPYTGNGKYGISIGNDVWIGESVTFAGSVTIGDGAIVAGNSHVVKDVAPYTIVGGNPAKFIRPRFDSESLISELLELKWWRYKFFDFHGLNLENPHEFVEQLKNMQAGGAIHEYAAPKVTRQELLKATSSTASS